MPIRLNTLAGRFRSPLLPVCIGPWKRGQRAEAVKHFRAFPARHSDDAEALNSLSRRLAAAEWSPLPPGEVVGYARRIPTDGNRQPWREENAAERLGRKRHAP